MDVDSKNEDKYKKIFKRSCGPGYLQEMVSLKEENLRDTFLLYSGKKENN